MLPLGGSKPGGASQLKGEEGRGQATPKRNNLNHKRGKMERFVIEKFPRKQRTVKRCKTFPKKSQEEGEKKRKDGKKIIATRSQSYPRKTGKAAKGRMNKSNQLPTPLVPKTKRGHKNKRKGNRTKIHLDNKPRTENFRNGKVRNEKDHISSQKQTD